VKRTLLLLIPIVLLTASVMAFGLTEDEALACFQHDEIMVETQDELQEVIDALIVAHSANPANRLILTSLAQAHFVMADAFLTDHDAKKATYEAGQLYGEAALRLNPAFVAAEDADGFVAAVALADDVAAVHWTAANWTAKDEYDVLGAIFRGDPPKLLALFERAMELDPGYAHGAPYRSLGAFWSGLPRLGVGTFTQNLDRSREALCHVVVDPDRCGACTGCPDVDDAVGYFENRVFYVRFVLIKTEAWETAEAVLLSVLAEPVGDTYPLYNRVNHERARRYLKQVREHLP